MDYSNMPSLFDKNFVVIYFQRIITGFDNTNYTRNKINTYLIDDDLIPYYYGC